MTQNNFFYRSAVVPTKRSMQKEKISQMNRRRKINELTVWVAVASVGGTVSIPLPLRVCSGGWRGMGPTSRAS